MNSPLEDREVRLRGLPQQRSAGAPGQAFTARIPALVQNDGVRQELSAQADIAVS
jgi:hypothetical protein